MAQGNDLHPWAVASGGSMTLWSELILYSQQVVLIDQRVNLPSTIVIVVPVPPTRARMSKRAYSFALALTRRLTRTDMSAHILPSIRSRRRNVALVAVTPRPRVLGFWYEHCAISGLVLPQCNYGYSIIVSSYSRNNRCDSHTINVPGWYNCAPNAVP